MFKMEKFQQLIRTRSGASKGKTQNERTGAKPLEVPRRPGHMRSVSNSYPLSVSPKLLGDPLDSASESGRAAASASSVTRPADAVRPASGSFSAEPTFSGFSQRVHPARDGEEGGEQRSVDAISRMISETARGIKGSFCRGKSDDLDSNPPLSVSASELTVEQKGGGYPTQDTSNSKSISSEEYPKLSISGYGLTSKAMKPERSPRVKLPHHPVSEDRVRDANIGPRLPVRPSNENSSDGSVGDSSEGDSYAEESYEDSQSNEDSQSDDEAFSDGYSQPMGSHSSLPVSEHILDRSHEFDSKSKPGDDSLSQETGLNSANSTNENKMAIEEKSGSERVGKLSKLKDMFEKMGLSSENSDSPRVFIDSRKTIKGVKDQVAALEEAGKKNSQTLTVIPPDPTSKKKEHQTPLKEMESRLENSLNCDSELKRVKEMEKKIPPTTQHHPKHSNQKLNRPSSGENSIEKNLAVDPSSSKESPHSITPPQSPRGEKRRESELWRRLLVLQSDLMKAHSRALALVQGMEGIQGASASAESLLKAQFFNQPSGPDIVKLKMELLTKEQELAFLSHSLAQVKSQLDNEITEKVNALNQVHELRRQLGQLPEDRNPSKGKALLFPTIEEVISTPLVSAHYSSRV